MKQREVTQGLRELELFLPRADLDKSDGSLLAPLRRCVREAVGQFEKSEKEANETTERVSDYRVHLQKLNSDTQSQANTLDRDRKEIEKGPMRMHKDVEALPAPIRPLRPL